MLYIAACVDASRTVLWDRSSGGHQITYSWQAGGTHPSEILSCFATFHNYKVAVSSSRLARILRAMYLETNLRYLNNERSSIGYVAS